MERYLQQIDALEDLTSILEFSRDICVERGVKRQSYHFSPIFDEPTSIRTVVYAHGYSPEWIERYENANFRKHDPIPGRTFEHGRLLPWHEAISRWSNTPEQDAYFAEMHEYGLIHGFGLPLFGPRGRAAFASMDFGKPLEQVDQRDLALVRILAQAVHQRLCNLIDASRELMSPSEREIEVLTWMARGKSNAEIATILQVSPETIKTYRERIYQKLGVNDRIGAVIRGLKLGLVRI